MNLTRMQINQIKEIIISLLKVNLANIEFQKSISKEKEHRKTFTRLIQHTNKSIELVRNIKHLDILTSLYNTFASGKEAFYITLSENVYKNVAKWDSSEEGHQEFVKLEQESKAQYEREQKEKKEKQLAIEKAKQEGKKIEWTMNEKGKLEQTIVEEKVN